MDTKTLERARELRKRGWNYTRIARELGIKTACVRYNLIPKAREQIRAYRKEYDKRPEVRERIRRYIQRPEVAARFREYEREHIRRPEVRERRRLSGAELEAAIDGPEMVKEVARKLEKRPSVVRWAARRNSRFVVRGDIIVPVRERKPPTGKLGRVKGWLGGE